MTNFGQFHLNDFDNLNDLRKYNETVSLLS